MKYKFKYPQQFVTLPEYSAHRGDTVEITRELRDGEEYDNEGEMMYEIKSLKDGWVGHAFKSELELIEV